MDQEEHRSVRIIYMFVFFKGASKWQSKCPVQKEKINEFFYDATTTILNRVTVIALPRRVK